MPSPNSLRRARIRATAGLLEAARLNPGFERAGHLCPASPTWMGMGPQRRGLYCLGDRAISPKLLYRLIVELPAVSLAWNSSAWLCLDQAETQGPLESKLRALVGSEVNLLPLEQLLEALAKRSLKSGPYDLGLVVTYICATRLAKLKRFDVLAGLLSMRLARSLHMLAVDDLFAPMAREIWSYFGFTYVRGLKVSGHRVRFHEDAMDFACAFIREAEAGASLYMLPGKPMRRLSVSALTEVVSEVLLGLTSTSWEKANRTLRESAKLGLHRDEVARRKVGKNVAILVPVD